MLQWLAFIHSLGLDAALATVVAAAAAGGGGSCRCDFLRVLLDTGTAGTTAASVALGVQLCPWGGRA